MLWNACILGLSLMDYGRTLQNGLCANKSIGGPQTSYIVQCFLSYVLGKENVVWCPPGDCAWTLSIKLDRESEFLCNKTD